MAEKKHYSLLISLGLVMATITLLAIGSITASLFIADTIQGQASAINESGALRMRSYRIASSMVYDVPDDEHWQETYLLISEFEQHLRHSNLTSALPNDKTHPLNLAYQQINLQWQNEIKPLFDIYLDGIQDAYPKTGQSANFSISEDAVINLRNRYFLVVADFVDDIDNLVSLLEQNAEAKIERLRLYQFIALGLTIILVITALILVYKRVHIPMRQLLIGAERVRNKDFSYRTPHTRQNELGQLGNAFNIMAEDLSVIYSELEERVHQKTRDLERSNQSMELLYKTVKRLNNTSSPQDTFDTILKDIEQLTGIGRGAICLSDTSHKKAAMLASTLQADDLSHQLCRTSNCNKCLSNSESQSHKLDSETGSKQVLTIPISDQNQQYGTLIIEPVTHHTITDWQQQLLESIAGHIGIAIYLSRQAAETRRFALMEERSVIARELHDSLAQSLTFMKIQVSRLQALIKQADTNKESEEVIAELRTGLNSAYQELRELLTTFRLKIDGEDFSEALLKTVAEFNERSSTQIDCDNQIIYCDLTPNEEIHLLQLIREALSNIVKHADADSARITIKYAQTGDMNICIEDNGKGMPDITSRTHHYGLSIMNERAATLNGKFNINNKPDGGTLVELTFTPANKAAPININK